MAIKKQKEREYIQELDRIEREALRKQKLAQ